MPPPVEDIFAGIAPHYDRVNGILTLSRAGELRRRLISALAPRPGIEVLDICAGTLECTDGIFRRFPDAEVTAVDICGAMLDVGLEKIPARHSRRLRVIRGDVLDIRLPESSFDAVVCAWGVRNVRDRESLLRRVRGWLKPGGRFIVMDLFRPSDPFRRTAFKTLGALLIPLVGAIFAGDRSAYRYLVSSVNAMTTPSEFEEMLLRHGFTSVRSEGLLFGTNHVFIAE